MPKSPIVLVLFQAVSKDLKSKCCIALPIDAEIVRIFEKTVMGGYSCVNTRMDFILIFF